MIGAIIGDIVGSRFEFNNYRKKDFDFFSNECFATDDSVMTLAVAKAIMESKPDYSDLADNTVKYMQLIGKKYPDAGYGIRFGRWLYLDEPEPYYSWGNGSAMRVSPCGFAAKTLEEAEKIAGITASVTHNHPEGITGAQSVAAAIFMARNNSSMDEIRKYISDKYYKDDFTLDEIRETYQFNESCRDTVPQAFEAFYESVDFEDCIRNAISVGGDSDTLAAIAGGIAEAYYGVPDNLRKKALSYLDDFQTEIFNEFNDYINNSVL